MSESNTQQKASSPDSAQQLYSDELPAVDPSPAPSWLRLLATISGLIGFVLLAAVPLLPINQTQSSFEWPQNDSLSAVNAPLISVAPEEIDATIPLRATDMLREGEDLLYSTVPPGSKEATSRGMFVYANDKSLSVTSLDEVILTLNEQEVRALDDDATIEISATEDGTTVSVGSHSETTEDDVRPQVTGVYTEIADTPENTQALTDAGLSISTEINSRFTSSPSAVKLFAMLGGVAMVLLSLFSLWRIDRLDGRRISFMPSTWKQVRPLDGVVAAILGFWHIFGANTSDDGFILTMGRVSDNATYMANYYRWYGVPESPFGSPFYDLVALMAQIWPASIFMRLTSLVAALVVWFILSREILPRFGQGINDRRVAHWTAAMMFLAFWLPYNNGIRPEPIVAMGIMLTWASFERSIATSRLLAAAVGTIIATLTLGAGPTGLFAVGIFLVCLPSLFSIISSRVPSLGGGARGWIALIAPFLVSGTAILAVVFGDQSFAAVMESIRVRSEVGPSLPWYSEYVRYATLFEPSADGSITRRFAVFTMLFSLALVGYSFLKKRSVANAPVGPTQRLMLIVALSMFFLMFTPTKWTHHFGIYAGVAGVIAALGAVVLFQIAMRSPRARTFAIAAVVLLLAISMSGWNAWWYVSSFGVPWWDRNVQFRGIEANAVILLLGLIILAIGVVQSLRHNYRARRAKEDGTFEEFKAESADRVSRSASIMSAPIALACAAMVAFSTLTFAKAYIDQYPAYSVGQGNIGSLTGQECALADEALVETNTNESFLQPVKGELRDSLAASQEDSVGFDPNGIPESIEEDNVSSAAVGVIGDATEDSSDSADSAAAGSDPSQGGASAGSETKEANSGGSDGAESQDSSEKDSNETESSTTGGGIRESVGVNGSSMQLPFNLDYNQIPVLGSYDPAQSSGAKTTTEWFELPEDKANAPLLVVSAAGRIEHHDVNNIKQDGLEFVLEYGTYDNGEVTNIGEAEMSDVGATPKWRNLRYPLEDLPAEADVVRFTAVDDSLDEEDWVAFTPPRVPELSPISKEIDSQTPGLLDWSVAFQFPCQRSFDHYGGVTEIPEFRILPDGAAQTSLTDFQSYSGGGAMSTAEAVNFSYEIPSYLDKDWTRDWGSIEKYELRTNSEGTPPAEAEIDYEEITRTGWWKNSEMKIRPEGSQ